MEPIETIPLSSDACSAVNVAVKVYKQSRPAAFVFTVGSMVSLKMYPFKGSFTPLKNAIAKAKAKETVRKQFKHVTCSDEDVIQYFKNALAARAAMLELGQRSWEYQFEFAVEMSKRCKDVMGEDQDMIEAHQVFERWILEHPHSLCRRFSLLPTTTLITNLYPRAQRLVVSQDALQFALSYSFAMQHKTPLHRIAVEKAHPLGPDLLSQRQRALERLVPEDLDDVELWDYECDANKKLVKVPNRVHLEWLCWGYTPDVPGVWECGNREFGDMLSVM